MRRVVVVIEMQDDGTPCPETQSSLAVASRCGQVVALTSSSTGITLPIEQLEQMGASQVINVPCLEGELPSSYLGQAAAEIINAEAAEIIVTPDTQMGREIAGFIAGTTPCGIITKVKEIEAYEDEINTFQEAFGGKWTTQARCSYPVVVTLAATDNHSAQPQKAQIEQMPITLSHRHPTATKVKKDKPSSSRPELSTAQTVVSGGRGVGSTEGYGLVTALADILGGATGASRGATDAEYAPRSAQVGQTGVVVSPSLYVAIGISGATQHLAGISGGATIIAINSDPNAPIFDVADFGVIGDLFTIVPQLLDLLNQQPAEVTT